MRCILILSNLSIKDKLYEFTQNTTNILKLTNIDIQKINELFIEMFNNSQFNELITIENPGMIILDSIEFDITDIFPMPLPKCIRLIVSYPVDYNTNGYLLRNKENWIDIYNNIINSMNETNVENIDNIGSTIDSLTVNNINIQLATINDIKIIELNVLNDTILQQIIEQKLLLYNKVLHPIQMSLLLANPGSKSLEWIHLACEELRVFGSFETITDYITNLPQTVIGLYKQNLYRNLLVASNYDDGTLAIFMKDALIFYIESQSGLCENELKELLCQSRRFPTYEDIGIPNAPMALTSDPNSSKTIRSNRMNQTQTIDNEIIPPNNAEMSIISLLIKPFLRSSMDYHNGSLLMTIISTEVTAMILEYFGLIDSKSENDYYNSYNQTKNILGIKICNNIDIKLANYFELISDVKRHIDEYPLQIINLKDIKRINRFIFNNNIRNAFEYCNWNLKRTLYNTIRCKEIINNYNKPLSELMCMNCALKPRGAKFPGRTIVNSCAVSLSLNY